MPAHTVFATGTCLDPRLHKEEVRWVAVRGDIHDWTIHYHLVATSIDYIKRSGDKCCIKEVIRQLVLCDDEVFKLYRF